MTASVAILDYGVGNLRSVARAFETCGAAARLVTDADEAANAERLVIPGVGAFGSCVEAVRARGFDAAIARMVRENQRPVLGICVGMQMLLDESDEFGSISGLGHIPGKVAPLAKQVEGTRRKVPHIGWAGLTPAAGDTMDRWMGTPLAATQSGAEVYFVHSYNAAPADSVDTLAVVDYLGAPVCAAVQKDNLVGFQFHPEKSGPVGLSILRHFLEL